MTHKGSCHCGRIVFEVEGDVERVIQCNCSICTKRGYLLWFVPRAQLHLATPEANLSTYTFKSGRIKHHFCDRCGSAPFGIGADKSGALTVAVNVRCLDGLDLSALTVAAFDGRSL